MTRAALASLAIAASVSVAACGFKVATPVTGPHENEEPITVPYPPPPARVETIPAPPKGQEKTAVWVDGAWEWRQRRWVWVPGDWEVPEKNSYYAPPMTIRLADGSLAYFPGAWRSAGGGPPPPAAK
ncbi:MAG TPA: hypothetical protein VHB21_12560 [Minicystis sp.]|nr:hypothetical protein [Minicystis sp.]